MLKGHPVPDAALRLACLTPVSQQPPCKAGTSGSQMRKQARDGRSLAQDPAARRWHSSSLNLGDLASQPRVQAKETAHGFLGAVGDGELGRVGVHKRHFCPRVVKSLEGWRPC